MSNNRRDFFKTLGTAAAGVAAAGPLIAPSAKAAVGGSKGESPTYVYALAFDQSIAGIIRDFDGGGAFAEVIREPMDGFGVVRKHLGLPKYEEISMSFGTNMSPMTYSWISNLLARQPVLRSGAILAADATTVFRSQLTFLEALLTEVRFPEVDVESRDPAYLSLKLSPEITRDDPPSIPSFNPKAAKPKPWLTNGFRLTIGGITEAATSRVSKIDAITIKQKLSSTPIGETRDPETTVDPLDIGPIVFNVPERFAQPFLDWHRQFVVLGNNSAESERTASIEYLGPKGEVHFTLTFGGVGICRASRIGENDKKLGLRFLQVELYAETANFVVGEPSPA